MIQLTCTCGSRYVRDGEHESDCDLWLIDEFWAGFLAWDWDREILVPTNTYPVGHESEYVAETDWITEYRAQADARTYGVEEMSEQQLVEAGGLSREDADILLTTDAFIQRMLDRNPADENDTWIKTDDGVWKKSGTAHTPGTYSSDANGYDWGNWTATDRHTQTPLHFANGVTVYGTSLSRANQCETTPDFALYLDGAWKPDGLAIMLPWRDYGLPNVSFGMADYSITEAYNWAEAGGFVEIGCIGAHGRTGTVMACMAVLSDPELSPAQAVAFVRMAYCEHAIETKEQEWYVARFHAQHHGLEAPAKPVYVAPAKVVGTTPAPKVQGTYPSGGSSTNQPDPAKPGRARRSRRGGKRHQRHRNRMTQGSRA